MAQNEYPCVRCGERTPMSQLAKALCRKCRMSDAAAEEKKRTDAAKRLRRLGYVGDERRAALVLEDFDRRSVAIREAAGCPRRP